MALGAGSTPSVSGEARRGCSFRELSFPRAEPSPTCFRACADLCVPGSFAARRSEQRAFLSRRRGSVRGLWKFPRSEPPNSIGHTPEPTARRAEHRRSTRRSRGEARFRAYRPAKLRRILFLSYLPSLTLLFLSLYPPPHLAGPSLTFFSFYFIRSPRTRRICCCCSVNFLLFNRRRRRRRIFCPSVWRSFFFSFFFVGSCCISDRSLLPVCD